MESGKPHGELLTGHKDEVERVAFSKDGELVASSSADMTARLWDIGLESLMTDACRVANRNLSQDEWSRFVGPEFNYVRNCSSDPGG